MEGWSENDRIKFKKKITNDQIKELLYVTKQQKQPIELFFIVNYDGWSMDLIREFREILPVDPDQTPKIHIKCTYIDPCPHTPISKNQLNTQYWDQKKTFKILNSANKRIRVFPTASWARAAWRTCLHRATPDEAMRLGKEPTDTNNEHSVDKYIDYLQSKNLTHLIQEQKYEPQARITIGKMY